MRDAARSLSVRRYGPNGGAPVVVLHGGPGAPGGARLLAEALADPFRVLEPWQRWSSYVPLTVAQHVADLAFVIEAEIPASRPALVGESWGAMLALAFAAAHPDRVAALALVGCGTFDRSARARLEATLEERTTKELAQALAELAARVPDENERARRAHALSDRLYTYERAVASPQTEFDRKGHLESWNDMLRLQDTVYPAAFARIPCPVLMLHGSYDPHPGDLIRDGLAKHLPQLEYVELDRCGHAPWIERHARDRFLSLLRAWLARNLG